MFWLAPICAINREYAYPHSITPYATYRSRKLAVWRRRRRHFLITITAGMTYPHVRLAGCAAGMSIKFGQMLWICWIYAGVLDGVGDCAVVRTGPRRGHPVGSLANPADIPGSNGRGGCNWRPSWCGRTTGSRIRSPCSIMAPRAAPRTAPKCRPMACGPRRWRLRGAWRRIAGRRNSL